MYRINKSRATIVEMGEGMPEVPGMDPTKVQSSGCDGHYLPRSKDMV